MANIPALNSLAKYINGTGLFANPNAGAAIASVAGAESGGFGGQTQGTPLGSSNFAISGYNPGSTGIGLFQDTLPSRQTGMIGALGSAAPGSLTGVQSQGAYAIDEIMGGTGGIKGGSTVLNTLNDPNASMSQMQGVLTNDFENPANPAGDIGRSATLGNQIDPVNGPLMAGDTNYYNPSGYEGAGYSGSGQGSIGYTGEGNDALNNPTGDHATDPNSNMFDSYSGFGAGNSTNTGGLTAPALDGGAGGSFAAGNPLGYGASGATDAAPVTPSATAAPSGGGTPATGTPGISGAGAGAGGTASAPTAKDTGGGGNPVDVVSNAPEISAANAIAKAATGVGSSITGAEGNAAVAGTTWLGNIFAAGTDIFARSTFVLLGLVILGGAGLFFYIESQKGSGGATIVPVPV
jgi:hypothetical protein